MATQNILELIARRTSVRSYRPELLSETQLLELRRAAESSMALTTTPFQFHVCSHEKLSGEVKGVLGDYGKVIQAPHYIVMTAPPSPGVMIDAGYRFQQMILEATRLGIGTCWVGGFFREQSLRSVLKLPESHLVIALTPVGWPAEASMSSRLMRTFAGSSKRKPVAELFFWESHGKPLPEALQKDPRKSQVFEAVRWAPSWANKQPWRFLVSQGRIVIYKQTSQMKEGKDYHALDCGIAMLHLHLACCEVGKKGTWTLTEGQVPGASGAEQVGVHEFIGSS